MYISKTLLQSMLILIISAFLGFANNYFSSQPVKISTERPGTPEAPDSTFHNSHSLNISEPVIINKNQLKNLIATEDVILVDARSPEEYAAGYISGAINIPFDHLGDYMHEIDALPKDQWLVTYCEGPRCDKAERLAWTLYEIGFERIAYYNAGLEDWQTTKDIEQ
ncbi:rhodanese-like domain-containing protein [candidate division KSB1 bacterium]|nr:rhodanese-like domain-containing protein [candidate division KSB1 bacterium]